MYRNK